MAEWDCLRRQLLGAMGAAGLGALAPAWAQKPVPRDVGRWPQQEVELTVPFPAGGNSALLGKTLARQFQQETGQAMRIEYRGGSGGTLRAPWPRSPPSSASRLASRAITVSRV